MLYRNELEKRLLFLLVKHSYNYNSEPIYKLASGKMSQYYIDCKTTTMTIEGFILVGKVIYQKIKLLPIQTVAGLEFGAIPLVLSTAYRFNHLNPLIIRKQPKDRGLRKQIEGVARAGDKAILLEDVTTTGGSVLSAAKILEDAEIEIHSVLSIIDREEGAKENILSAGYNFKSIFTLSDLQKYFDDQKGPTNAT